MNKIVTTCLSLTIAVVLLSAASSARADWPWGEGFYGGYNWGFQRYALTNNQMPPYFAMFPPVYYRAPIQARTYGTSPYAYPPCNCRPTVEALEPEVIENPYVKPDADAKPMPTPKPKADTKGKSTRTQHRVEPLVIINPYVKPDAPSAVAQK